MNKTQPIVLIQSVVNVKLLYQNFPQIDLLS